MSSNKTAKRYAKALFDLARKSNQLDPVHADLQGLCQLVSESEELRHFWQNPILSEEQRASVLDALLKERLHVLSYRYLLFLNRKKRWDHFDAICSAFDTLYNRFREIQHIKIIAAAPISEAQQNAICEKLRERLHKEIKATVEVDFRLIGGFKIRIGDAVHDFTIASKLEQFKQKIMHG